MSSRCEYSTADDNDIDASKLEISKDKYNETYLGPGREWACPRKTKGGADCCLFHTQPKNRDLPPSQVSQIILDTFNESNSHELDDEVPSWRDWDIIPERKTDGARYRRERKQFIGAKLSDVTLEFEYADCNGNDNYPIDLRGATIQGIDIYEANVVGGFRLHQVTLTGNKDSEYGDLSAVDATINGSLESPSVTAESLSLDKAVISGNVTLSNTELTASVSFNDAEVGGEIDLSDLDVANNVILSDISAKDRIHLKNTDVQNLVCDGASMDTLTIEGNSSITGRADLSGTEFHSELRIDSKAFDHPCIHSIDLSKSTISAGRLIAHRDPHTESDKNSISSGAPFIFDLSKSEIGDVKIAPNCNCESAASLEHAYICESTLKEFEFKQTINRSDLRTADWKVHSLAPGGHTIRGMRDEHKKYNINEGAGGVAAQFIEELRRNESLQTHIINHEWEDVINQYGNLYNGPTSDDLDQTFASIQREAQLQTAQPFKKDSRSASRPLLSMVNTKLEEQPLEDFVIHPCDPNVSEAGVHVCDQTALLGVLHLISKNIRTIQEDDDELTESVVHRWHSSLTTVIAHRFALERNIRPTPGELESTYLLGKNGAGHEGDQMAAGKFFQIEKLWARKQYINGPDGTTIKDIYRYVSNRFFSAIAGYGERPQRVFGWSIFVIGVFSLFYWGVGNLLLGDNSNMTVVEAGIASFGSFVTLFLQPDSFFSANLLKLSAQIEGLIGVFSVSLFVYALTRSVHR